MSKDKKIGFSFSGGGARSSAHIGIIQAFNEHGIQADYVAGTSGGAIVATLYAAGLTVSEMKEFAGRGSLFKLFTAGLPIKGLTGLDYLGDLLEEYIGSDRFDELNIPLSITVANLVSGKKEVLNSGNLYSAVMASCAIPLVFKPVEINGQIYVDGGVFDNLPVETIRPYCDVLIGMNLMPNTPVSDEELDNMFSIGMRVFDMAVASNAQVNYPLCDLIIEPHEALDYHLFNFGASKELIEIGYKAAKEQIPSILAKIQ